MSNENFHNNNQIVNIQELYRRNDLESNQIHQPGRRASSALLHPSVSTSDLINNRHNGLLHRRRSSQPVLSTFDEPIIEDNQTSADYCQSQPIIENGSVVQNNNMDISSEQKANILLEPVSQLTEMYSEMQQDVSKLCDKMSKFDRTLKALYQQTQINVRQRPTVPVDSRRSSQFRRSNMSSETSL